MSEVPLYCAPCQAGTAWVRGPDGTIRAPKAPFAASLGPVQETISFERGIPVNPKPETQNSNPEPRTPKPHTVHPTRDVGFRATLIPKP